MVYCSLNSCPVKSENRKTAQGSYAIQSSSAHAAVTVRCELKPVVEGPSLGPSQITGTCVPFSQVFIVPTQEMESWKGLGPEASLLSNLCFILININF